MKWHCQSPLWLPHLPLSLLQGTSQSVTPVDRARRGTALVTYLLRPFNLRRDYSLYLVVSFLGSCCFGSLIGTPSHFPRTLGFSPQALKQKVWHLIEEGWASVPSVALFLASCTKELTVCPRGREESLLGPSSLALLKELVVTTLFLSMFVIQVIEF